MKNKKKFFIICGILAAVGFLIAVIGISLGGLVTSIRVGGDGLSVQTLEDRKKEGKNSYIEDKKTLEEFQSMDIDLEYVDLEVKISDHYGIEYGMDSVYKLSYEVENGRLKVVQKTKHSFSLFSFGIGFNNYSGLQEKNYVIIYVPEDVSLKEALIKNDSGDITYVGINAHLLNIKDEYGDVEIKEVESSDVTVKADSGNILLDQIKSEGFTIENEYGEVSANQIESDEIKLTLDSGDCEIHQIKAEKLIIKNEYGGVFADQVETNGIKLTLDSGNCKMNRVSVENIEVDAEYGDVEIALNEDIYTYGYDLNTEYGDITLDGDDKGEQYTVIYNDKNRNIKINCDSGNVKISQE